MTACSTAAGEDIIDREKVKTEWIRELMEEEVDGGMVEVILRDGALEKTDSERAEDQTDHNHWSVHLGDESEECKGRLYLGIEVLVMILATFAKDRESALYRRATLQCHTQSHCVCCGQQHMCSIMLVV